MHRPLLLVPLLVLLPLASGCKSSTFQASSESSSNSIGSVLDVASSPFKMSSRSSGGGEDVEEATTSFVLSDGDLVAFRRDLGRIAREHGISDWETHEPIWWSIGRGLRRAGVEGERLEELKTALADVHPGHRRWIQWGYESP